MPTEARGNYLPEPPYLRETKTYHSQSVESIRHAGNYFVPLSIRPIFIFFCCRSYVKLLDYWRAENFFLYFQRPPEAWGPCHLPHLPHGSSGTVWDKVLEGSTLIFGDTRIFLNHGVGHVEGSLRAKNELDPFIHFSRTPTCDSRTDRHWQTRGHSIYRTRIASRGKN